jgi:hypothetical protein
MMYGRGIPVAMSALQAISVQLMAGALHAVVTYKDMAMFVAPTKLVSMAKFPLAGTTAEYQTSALFG